MTNNYNSFFKLRILFSIKGVLLFLGIVCFSFSSFAQSTVVVNDFDGIATEGTATNDTGIFEIDLGSVNNTGGNIIVNYDLDGTAVNGTDYTNLNTSVIIGNGDRKVQLIVTPINDSFFEGNESITIRLTGTNNAGFIVAGNSSSTASIILVDDDGCTSGPDAPQINTTTETKYCSGEVVDLSSFITSETPPGTTLQFSISANPNPNNPNSFLSNSTITTADNYYGFYYGTFNGNPCVSPVVTLPVITFDPRPSVGVLNTNNQACNNLLSFNSTIDLDDALTGATPGGTWNLVEAPTGQNSVIGNGNRVSYLNQPVGAYTYSYTPNYAAAPNCEDESIQVTIFVTDCSSRCAAGNSPPELNRAISTFICIDENNQTVDLREYTTSTAPQNIKLIWSRDRDFTKTFSYLDNTIIQSTGTYYAFFLDEANNCASPVLSVSIIFNKKPEITPTVTNALCNEGIMTLSATATEGSIVNWYSSLTSNTPLEENSLSFTTPNLTTTTTYYVQASLNGCTSDRQPVVASISNEPVVQAIANPLDACSIELGSFPSVIDLSSGLTLPVVSGTWAVTSGPSTSIAITNSSIVDFLDAPIGNYTFTFTTNTAVAPCSDRSVVITVRVNQCIVDSDNDGLSDEDEIAIGTNPNNDDSDGDGILDDVEVGNDINNPLDLDNDGIIDALDSNILDSDMDGVVNQLDPANLNPCIPDNTVGMCDTDGDGISDGTEIANGSDPFDPCDPNLTPNCAPNPIDLQIVKTVDVLRPTVDDEITFTITLTNLSSDRVIRITINELLTTARGFEYISHTVTNGLYNKNTGVWDLQEIQGNEVNTLIIRAKILEYGDYINTAEIVSSFPRDNNAENNISSITLDINRRNTKDCGFLFNQFSPNNDGINDFLIINCIENYPNNSLEIFDRYGNQVYKAIGYDNSWDGNGKNGNVPKGTYYYILDLGNNTTVEKGWIQIIR